jgi:hypothetical protein
MSNEPARTLPDRRVSPIASIILIILTSPCGISVRLILLWMYCKPSTGVNWICPASIRCCRSQLTADATGGDHVIPNSWRCSKKLARRRG